MAEDVEPERPRGPVREAAFPVVRLAARVPPPAWDAVLAAAVFAVTLGPARLTDATGLALQTALVLPLVWRRRAPLAVFGTIAAVASVQLLLDIQLPADVALLVALGTVGAHRPGRWALGAALVLEAGALLSAARWAPEGRFLASAAALTAAVAASALLGVNARIGRNAREDRAAHLERERERRERLAVLEERARIARELHDSVSHGLSVVVALADAVGHARPEDTRPVTDRIAETGRQALSDMRRSLGLLGDGDPDAVRHPPPGFAQLETLRERTGAAGLPTRLRLDGDPTRVPAGTQLTAYRIVQESLTNALRHTPPGTRAEVRVVCSPEAVTVEVTDDGPPAAVTAPGRGITGMRERVSAHGGTLRAGPLPGGGWRVTARLGHAAEAPSARGRLARSLAALSGPPPRIRHGDDPPPRDRPHRTPPGRPCGQTVLLPEHAPDPDGER
ncbi:sensor histidine kinase [Streptomyces sp. NPDC094049]|uniref:sensor histidine kinase n=1 Tax=Streptomyces sp. NPDC094049 TaxID=3154987 RepID=UPI00331EF95F